MKLATPEAFARDPEAVLAPQPFSAPGPMRRISRWLSSKARLVSAAAIYLDAADNADLFDDQRLGAASETVPAWVEELVGP